MWHCWCLFFASIFYFLLSRLLFLLWIAFRAWGRWILLLLFDLFLFLYSYLWLLRCLPFLLSSFLAYDCSYFISRLSFIGVYTHYREFFFLTFMRALLAKEILFQKLLLFLMNSPVIHVSLCWFGVYPKEQSEPHLHAIRLEEVPFASNHKRASWQKLACWSWLRDLIIIHPPGSWENFCVPCFWSADCKDSGFFKRRPWHWQTFQWSLDDSGCSSSIVRVHVQIATLHVPLDKEFVHVTVSTRDDEVALRRDEPIELFKPKWFSGRYVLSQSFCSFLLDLPQGFLFSHLKNLLAGLHCSLLLVRLLPFSFVV